ncbi:hypothetical protein [Cupriavidus sp. amp6]|uniref:hypothetical protein n=1 Tax=Cupriavidus sp. amp6 TaxID=388051 RepID=UPI00048D0321|nr:hypothetical protein [Cupriavidus sp. amp6]
MTEILVLVKGNPSEAAIECMLVKVRQQTYANDWKSIRTVRFMGQGSVQRDWMDGARHVWLIDFTVDPIKLQKLKGIDPEGQLKGLD